MLWMIRGSIPESLAAKQLIFNEQISIEIRKSSRIIGRAGVDMFPQTSVEM